MMEKTNKNFFPWKYFFPLCRLIRIVSSFSFHSSLCPFDLNPTKVLPRCRSRQALKETATPMLKFAILGTTHGIETYEYYRKPKHPDEIADAKIARDIGKNHFCASFFLSNSF